MNTTSYTITQLYVALESAPTWGADQLPATIGPGGSFTLTDIPVGTYDIRAVASDGMSYWQTNSVAITANATTPWTLLPPQVGSLQIANHHCNPIDELYVSPVTSTSWGTDQLSGTVAPDGTFTLPNIPDGLYDVQAVAEDGIYWESYGIAITGGATYLLSLYMPSGTGCLEVVNSSSYTIGYLYTPTSPSGCTYDSWGPNQLGTQTIPSGYAYTLSNVPAGFHDLDAASPAGSPYWNTCSSGSAYITAGQIYTWTLNN